MVLNKSTTTRLSEIFQSKQVKLAFVNKKKNGSFSQCTSEVLCRDFLGDVIWSNKTGNFVSIYGFQYHYKTHPYDEDMLRLSLSFPSEVEKENFLNNFSYLTDKEIRAKVTPSVIITCDNHPLSIIIEADKVWQSNMWKLSLFTFYLKIMSYKDVKNLSNPEDRYMAVLTSKIEDKLLSKVNTVFIEELNTGISNTHNYSGFVSVIKKLNPVMYTLLLGE